MEINRRHGSISPPFAEMQVDPAPWFQPQLLESVCHPRDSHNVTDWPVLKAEQLPKFLRKWLVPPPCLPCYDPRMSWRHDVSSFGARTCGFSTSMSQSKSWSEHPTVKPHEAETPWINIMGIHWLQINSLALTDGEGCISDLSTIEKHTLCWGSIQTPNTFAMELICKERKQQHVNQPVVIHQIEVSSFI